METKLIYIVDDEQDILQLVNINLKKAGYITKTFEDADRLMSTIQEKMPDLLILDLMLPFTDGLEVCKNIRSEPSLKHLPIIMLTAKGEEMDRILGLELGADDYITKPFSPRELTARVKAILRRANNKDTGSDIIKIGQNVLIDTNQFKAKVDEKFLDLTNTEVKLLQLLGSKKGWVFSRDQILNHLWGNEKIVIDRTIDVHINHLRKKLGESGKYIKNVRGVGYKIEES